MGEAIASCKPRLETGLTSREMHPLITFVDGDGEQAFFASDDVSMIAVSFQCCAPKLWETMCEEAGENE
jgi:hypothetical protein